MKNLFLGFILLFFTLSCSESYVEPEHSKEAGRVMAMISSGFKERGFFVNGSGGSMPEDIKSFFFDVSSAREPTVDEARILYLKEIERVIKLVREDEKVQPFLHDEVFDIENIELLMSFFPQDQKRGEIKYPKFGKVTLVFHKNKMLYYSTYNPKNPRYKELEDLYEEPLEEAFRIFHASK